MTNPPPSTTPLLVRAFRILVRIVEGLLIAGVAGLCVWGKADGLALKVPFLTLGIAALIAGVYVTAIVGMRHGVSILRDWRFFCGIPVITFACVHLTKTTTHPFFLDSPLAPVYLVALMILGASGRALPWCAAAAIVLLGESGSGIVKSGATILGYLPEVAPYVAWLLLAGCAPFLVSRKLLQDAEPAPAAPQAGPEPAPIQSVKTTSLMRDAGGSLPDVDDSGRAVAGMTEILASVVYFMQRNFEAYSALGFIFDPVRQAFALNSYHSKSVLVSKELQIPLGKGIVGKVGAEKRSFLSGDLSLYEGNVGYYAGPEIVNSILAVPIISEERELLGALVVDSKNKRVFTDQHKEIMRRFSSLAAALITNARLRIEQQKTAHHFKVFYETAQKFTTAPSIDEIFSVIIDTAVELTNPTRAMAVIVDKARNRGVVQKVSASDPGVQAGFEFPINDGIYSQAITQCAALSVGDLAETPGQYYRFLPDEPPDPLVRSLIVLPIIDDASRCLGLLGVESSTPHLFEGELEPLLSTLAGNASVAAARALLYRKMEKLATTDGLTGLNNHRTFQDQLSLEIERSRRYNRRVSLLMMDIDHFKKFNDTYGHPVGDLVLREIALCIKRSIRTSDFAARYGGEEFVVILPENEPQGARITAERIRKTVENRVIENAGQTLRVTVSVGCVSFPSLATDKAALIEAADKALYWSKEHGRNRVTVYSEEVAGGG